MALSATATRSVRKVVSRRLCMHNPYIVAVPPCRDNIKYSVSKFTSFNEAFSPYVSDIVLRNINADRVIVYCNSFRLCCDIRDLFYKQLHKNRLYPPNAPLDKSQ